eukprot:12199368-Karenia_brevis.AAC.1
MEDKLWLPEELPTPIAEAMPALNAAHRSRASATAMATAFPWGCARRQKSRFLSSQVGVHLVDGRELNQCRECYVELECNGKDVSDTRLRNTVG